MNPINNTPIYREENGQYSLDCRKAIWSTDQINTDYHAAKLFLSDVDWIIENEDNMILVEYKNSAIQSASAAEGFDPNSDEKRQKVVRKYFDSLHYLTLLGKLKEKKFVYILEYPAGDSVSRKMLRNKLQKLLPFQLQEKLNKPNGLITSIEVLSINEWNNHKIYGNYPLQKIIE